MMRLAGSPRGRSDHAGASSNGQFLRSGWPGAKWALIVYLVLLLALPQQLVFGPLGSAGSPAMLWGIGCALWWLWYHAMRVQPVEEPRAVRWSAITFFGVVLVSYIHAMLLPIAADELSVADSGLLRVLSWLGVLLVAADGLPDLREWNDVLNVAVVMCGLVALLGIVQAVTGQAWVDRLTVPGLAVHNPVALTPTRGGYPRPVGTATHAIEFGQILTVGLLIAISMATARGTLVNRAAAALCAGAAVLVVSRSAVVSISAGLLVLIPALGRRQKIQGAFAGLGVLVMVYLLRPGLLGTLSRMFTEIEADPSARSRTDSYEYAFHAVAVSPVLGKGFGTFLPEYRILDNQWLVSLIDIGVVGVAAFATFVLAVIVTGLRASRYLRGTPDAIITRGVTASVVAICVGLLLYDGFAFPQASGLFFLMAGLAAAAFRLAKRPASMLSDRCEHHHLSETA